MRLDGDQMTADPDDGDASRATGTYIQVPRLTAVASMYVAAVSLRHGDVVMRREVWRGTPQLIYPARVVEDAGDRLTVFLASGTPLSSPDRSWQWSPEGHPWAARGRWEGHGVLQ